MPTDYRHSAFTGASSVRYWHPLLGQYRCQPSLQGSAKDLQAWEGTDIHPTPWHPFTALSPPTWHPFRALGPPTWRPFTTFGRLTANRGTAPAPCLSQLQRAKDRPPVMPTCPNLATLEVAILTPLSREQASLAGEVLAPE